ncbi:MAG: hypothetical protein PHX62_02105 [Bacilli bacterium]|nr:hypothetical protein [Bacilli bacterium]
MKRKELQKKYNSYLLLFLSSFFVLIFLIIIGGMSMDNGNTLLGILFLSVAALCFIISIVFLIVVARKYRPLINEAFSIEIADKLTKEEGKTTFITEDKKEVVFEEYYFLFNNRNCRYEDFEFAIAVKNKLKLMLNEVELILLIYSEDEVISLTLDGDLISEIKKNNIKLVNEDDYQYLIDNIPSAARQILRGAAFQQRNINRPLSFVKNETEKKAKRKVNAKLIIINVIIFIFLLGINALFIWLGQTEEGIQVSDTLTFNLGFKIVFSIIVLCLTFIKAKKIKWYGKLVFIFYLLMYWLGLMFLSGRLNVLLTLVFAIVFVSVGITIMDKKTLKKNPFNRMIGFSMFLFLMLVYNTMDYQIEGLGKIAAVSAIIAGSLTLISVFVIIIYGRRKMAAGEINKKAFIVNTISIPLCIMMFGFLFLFFGIQNLNYCLDTSEATIFTKEIIELERGGENDSDKAKVIINGKEVEIPIPTALYFDLEVGDSIEISLYSGGLGFEYYILEELPKPMS